MSSSSWCGRGRGHGAYDEAAVRRLLPDGRKSEVGRLRVCVCMCARAHLQPASQPSDSRQNTRPRATMQRPNYSNPPPAHSPPRMCTPHWRPLWRHALRADTAQSTTPSPSMSRQSPNCGHRRPRSRPRSPRADMDTASRAAACPSSRPTACTPRLAASSTTPRPNWASRWARAPWMPASNTSSRMYVTCRDAPLCTRRRR